MHKFPLAGGSEERSSDGIAHRLKATTAAVLVFLAQIVALAVPRGVVFIGAALALAEI